MPMQKDSEVESMWDAFISHASEDKDSFVRPLASALADFGVNIWYDEFTLKLGDSLSQSIDKGLAKSRYGVVVLSKPFMSKSWPQRELSGLVTREVDGHSTILPIWHGVTRAQVSEFSPTLADKLAVRTSDATAIDIALQILQLIRPDIYDAQPRADLEKLANGEAIAEMQDELATLRSQLSEFQCPYCQSPLNESVDAPMDPEEKHWDVVRTFECGYRDYGGTKDGLCPEDPDFPKLHNYTLKCEKQNEKLRQPMWICRAFPSTEAARLVSLPNTFGDLRPQTSSKIW